MAHKLAPAAQRTARAAKAAAPTALDDAHELCSAPSPFEETDSFVVEPAAAQAVRSHPMPAIAPPPFDVDDQDPPFDAPDCDDEIFQTRRVLALGLEDVAPEDAGKQKADAGAASALPFAPAIAIHVAWERPDAPAMLAAFACDKRLARTEITEADGGIDAACAYFDAEASPDLLIIDTALGPATLIDKLDRLLLRLGRHTHIMLIGEANDVGLLRDLARRGVAHYLLAPEPEAVISQICELYAERDNARIIAVVGARGGAGASTVAQNIAWSIAERQQAQTALVDLDLSFGVAGFDFDERGVQSMGVGFLAPDIVDDNFLARAARKQSERLSVFAAPGEVAQPFDLEAGAVGRVLAQVRRTAQWVVVDVPHRWSPWVKAVLTNADEVLLVATPDLASLRNAKNIVEALKEARQARSEALLMLSMVGRAKGPEISAHDFADAVGAKPVESLPFDPALFGMAAIKNLPIASMAPRAQAAAVIDRLAWVLTGREPAARTKAKRLLKKVHALRPDAAQALPPSAEPDAQSQAEPQVLPDAAGAKSSVLSSAPKKPRGAAFQRSYASAQRQAAPAHDRKPGAVRAAMAVMLVAVACGASLHNGALLRTLGQAAGVLH